MHSPVPKVTFSHSFRLVVLLDVFSSWPAIHHFLLRLSTFTLISKPICSAMARPAAYALLATVFARAISASLEFTNPLPYNTDGNVSNYQTYKKGHSLLVLWSGGDPSENVSILLVQQDFHSLVYSESLRGIKLLSSMINGTPADFSYQRTWQV